MVEITMKQAIGPDGGSAMTDDTDKGKGNGAGAMIRRAMVVAIATTKAMRQ